MSKHTDARLAELARHIARECPPDCGPCRHIAEQRAREAELGDFAARALEAYYR